MGTTSWADLGLRLLPGLVLVGLSTAVQGCQAGPPDAHRAFRLSAQRQSVSIFELYFEAQDKAEAHDVGKALADSLERLRTSFRHPFQTRVAVEIYPDQASYDAHLMDASVAGSPACSGNRTIQMVSPRSPIRVEGLPYKSRLSMAVHELAHLFINELNRDVPMWLHEGVASFAGDAEGYRTICRLPQAREVLESPPSIAELYSSFRTVRAADVHSFTAVEYIIARHGWPMAVALIRAPSDFERILRTSKDAFTVRWHDFVRDTYLSSWKADGRR